MSDEQTRYPQVVRAITETPWAIELSTLAVIRDLVHFRANGGRLTSEEISELVGARPASRPLSQAGAVAVLPLYGVIMPRASLMTEMSGGTSLERFTNDLRALAGNDQIGSIVLHIDSPGGMTGMVPETAAEVRAVAQRKPVLAVASTMAASAAYYIGSQANEFSVTPSGYAGSIGVYHIHEDISAMEEKLGIKTTLTSAGRYKTEGNPFEPLSEEAQAAIQAQVDQVYSMFVADVAKGRGVSVADVRNGFGEGRVVSAKDAVKLGMADRVETLDAAITRAASGKIGTSSRRALAAATDDSDDRALELFAASSSANTVVITPVEAEEPEILQGAERLLSRPAFRRAVQPA